MRRLLRSNHRPQGGVGYFSATEVSNSTLDKRGPLTRAEFDRVEFHTMLTG
jgi:hypothetical protein